MLAACHDKTGKKEKVYLVATDASYAPFESVNSQNEIVGFDVDILKAVAEKANIQVQFINTPWEGIFSALAAGDRDMVMSCVTITDDRKKSMDFSEPYFKAQQLIAVRSDSQIRKFSDLKTKKVGVQNSTSGDMVTQNLLGRDSTNIKRFETMTLALQEMLNGGVDAVVGDNGAINFFVKQNSHVKMKILSDPSFTQEFYGYAVKKGNTALVEKLNQGINTIKEDGTYQKIYDQYFGAIR
jgi:polar amino acid transport system substrate-binding protein